MRYIVFLFTIFLLLPGDIFAKQVQKKEIAYIVSDIRIPFWNIMSRGIISKAKQLGYTVHIYSADNSRKKELQNTVEAIKKKVDGILLSPISSSSAVTILKLASQADIPVVISDIGTDAGEYVSYISSDNFKGAYKLGKILVKKMYALNWQDGGVGIIAIPQQRDNGKERTAGFIKALEEAHIKSSGLRQQVDFSYKETYDFTLELIKQNPNLRALWLQGSDRYQAALDAIAAAEKKEKILLICFDAEPEFLELIPKGILVGAAMQQPFLMGEEALQTIDRYLNDKGVKRNIILPILDISAENIKQNLLIIKRNVLGQSKK